MKNLGEFIPSEPLSEEAKKRLEIRAKKDKKRLEKMKEDYNNGVFDDIIKELKYDSKRKS